jgi:hypothetical protein
MLVYVLYETIYPISAEPAYIVYVPPLLENF